MVAQSLYDLAPLGRLLAAGALLALLPLGWGWLRRRGAPPRQRLAWLAGLTLFLAFDLVLFGAFTRLTDSGLGCPDWPGCYGSASPWGARGAIELAQQALPDGPVTWSKAWIEMIHRYLATGVGGLIVVLAAVSWVERDRRWIASGWPLLTLAWVCLQGAFGALTVTMKLFPAIVTLHLLGGMVLLALLRVQTVRYRLPEADSLVWVGLAPGSRIALWSLFALVWLQIALGGWVSTNYAVLACTEFPACHGAWWPEMDFSAGFELWRGLGRRASGEALLFPALTAIHYAHRLWAYLVLVAMLALSWHLWRQGRGAAAHGLLGLALWQLASGLSNVVLGWPLPAALAHTGGAAAIVVVLTGWLTQIHPQVRITRCATIAFILGRTTMSTIALQPSSTWHQFYALMKPRVIQLIVFCALIGMVLAVPGLPSAAQVLRALLACLGIWLVAGAAAAFNCIVEQRIDARMRRTAWRPTARGELSNRQTLTFSALLCGTGSLILYFAVNALTMWLTFATFVGYAVIYTVVLKPRTPQNIVIGGASGAMPPVLGWTAMTDTLMPEALLLFLIIFLWTPPHFWALALYRVEDYRKAGLPMLPVTHGSEYTRLQILLYTLVLLAACLLPFMVGMSGWLYLVVALALNAGFIAHALALWQRYSDALARKTFRYSLIHLSLLFAALLVDHYL